MVIVVVVYIYVYLVVLYWRESFKNLNKFDSVVFELEEDIEVVVISLKESVKDVVVGGGEYVSVMCFVVFGF